MKNRVCVITGGAGVLGAAIVKGLASSGIRVAILDLDEEKAKSLADEVERVFKVKCIGIFANVLEKESLNTARKLIIDQLGKPDILINAAGGNSPDATTKLTEIDPGNMDSLDDSFFGLPEAGFNKVFSLNFMGTLNPTLVFSKDMVKDQNGVILNVSSMTAFRTLTKVPAYSAAKAAVNSFTQWLAVHFGKTGVRVNAIAPGFFLTDQNRFLLTDKQSGELTGRGSKILENTPMGRFGKPEDLQGICNFLVSDDAAFLTGVVVPVDGGYSAFGGV